MWLLPYEYNASLRLVPLYHAALVVLDLLFLPLLLVVGCSNRAAPVLRAMVGVRKNAQGGCTAADIEDDDCTNPVTVTETRNVTEIS